MRLRNLEYKHVVAIVFVLGLFMELLDSTVVNVALPSIREDLRTGGSSIEWVVIGYLLSARPRRGDPRVWMDR